MELEWDDYEHVLKKRLAKVYNDTVIDHALNPRNYGTLDNPDGSGGIDGWCGDSMDIWLKIDDNIVTDARFTTDGCESTIAAGSMVTELAKGKTVDQVLSITEDTIVQALGGLPADSMHCASLAALTLQAALKDYTAKKQV